MKIFFCLFLILSPALAYSQIVETIVGNGIAGYSGDNGPADSAELNQPTSVKFDHSGNMYIADAGNNVIRMVNKSGIITTIVGNGIAGNIGDNGLAINAEINSPNDIAFDALGNLYIADWGNEAIRKVTTSGVITTIAGNGGVGYNGDGIPATSAELNDPLGLVFDSIGNLYFSDNGNHRVRKISSLGIITTIVGTGVGGFSGDTGPADSAQVRLPEFINLSPSGNLYVPDAFNHRVRMVNAFGVINTVAGNGIAGYAGEGGPADSAEVAFPWTTVFDNSGNYFISDIFNGTIHKVNTAGIITTIAGNGIAGYGGDGGPALNAEFSEYAGCTAADAGGNLYIADMGNNRIRRILFTPTEIYTAANNINKLPANISIFPNPTHDKLTISSTQKITDITVDNPMGQTVYHQKYNNENIEVNVANLPSGIYFIKINGTEVRKFIKE